MRNTKLKNILLIPLFSAIIAISAQLQIPFALPFTLQLLAIFMALILLGGIGGAVSVLLYISLGLIGLPVFSGFASGFGYLFSAAGGYIIGFIPLTVTYTVMSLVFGKRGKRTVVYALISLIPLYLTAILWLTFVYTDATQGSLLAAISLYVLPFVLPDVIKCIFASIIAERIEKAIRNGG